MSIGDVAVHLGMPPQGNPYRGESLIGPPRRKALALFKSGETGPYTFWFAPCSGGARRLTDPAEVNWKTSGLP